jgi:uncharacterized membrane protein
MPILIMGLFALALFIVFGFLFFSAMAAEHRQRNAMQKAEEAKAAKAVAQGAGR